MEVERSFLIMSASIIRFKFKIIFVFIVALFSYISNSNVNDPYASHEPVYIVPRTKKANLTLCTIKTSI